MLVFDQLKKQDTQLRLVAVVLAYPAVNASYIAMKHFAVGIRDGAQGR